MNHHSHWRAQVQKNIKKLALLNGLNDGLIPTLKANQTRERRITGSSVG
jgi:hypothetical protein